MTPVVDWLPALIESGRLQLDIKSFGELYQRVSNHELLHDITDVYMLKSSAFFVVVLICFFKRKPSSVYSLFTLAACTQPYGHSPEIAQEQLSASFTWPSISLVHSHCV